MKSRPARKTFRQRLEHMVQELRKEIAAGSFKPGQFLPSEEELAKLFQLSNKSVRQGLHVLVEEGLIEKLPRIGNKVTEAAGTVKTAVTLACRTVLIEQARLDLILERFRAKYPHIEVKLITLDYNNYTQATKQLMESKALDIIMLNHMDFMQMAECDGLELLERFPPDPNAYPFLNDLFMQEQQLCAKPFAYSPVILCYNKRHFQQMGMADPDSSWTWDTVQSQAELLSNRDRYGFYFNILSDNRWLVYLLQSGLTFARDERGRYTYSEQRLKECLRVCRSLIANKKSFPSYMAESERDVQELFLQEKVSIVMTTYFALNNLSGAAFPYDIAPLPYTHAPATLLQGIGWAVNRLSPEKEAAKLLVDFLTSHEGQTLIERHTLSLPALKMAETETNDTAETESESLSGSLRKPTRYQLYKEIIPSFTPISDLNLPLAKLTQLKQCLKYYWFQMEDEEQAVRRIEEMLNAPLSTDSYRTVQALPG
ncbi:extracellular solute-binding protein [Paenibacillus hemerocallicola]|nr:extracellular solute-binding protein [Paenibacillus hemerocallicola]